MRIILSILTLPALLAFHAGHDPQIDHNWVPEIAGEESTPPEVDNEPFVDLGELDQDSDEQPLAPEPAPPEHQPTPAAPRVPCEVQASVMELEVADSDHGGDHRATIDGATIDRATMMTSGDAQTLALLESIRDAMLTAEQVRAIVKDELTAHRKLVLEYQKPDGKPALQAVAVDSKGKAETKLPPGAVITHIDGIPVQNSVKTSVARPAATVVKTAGVTARSYSQPSATTVSVQTSAPYRARWTNYDGLSKREHARVMHGLDVSTLSDRDIAIALDNDHDRTGPGHPGRTRAVVRTSAYSNDCPGGVCPTNRTTTRTTTRSGPRFPIFNAVLFGRR